MTAGKQTIFWLGAMVALLSLVALLSEILLPFVVGAAIAYFLDPLADRLQTIGLTRLWATIVIVLVFSLFVVLCLVFILPPLVDQLIGLVSRFPGYFQSLRDLSAGYLERWFGDSWPGADLAFEGPFSQLAGKAAGWIGNVLGSVWSGGLALVNFLALIVITPVVTFYLLLDWDRMMQQISQWLPRDQARTIRKIGREIDEVISGFVRGQLTVLAILALFYVLGLTLIGLNFGLLIGLGAGLISFVPFAGPIAGFLVGGAVAVVQFWPEWPLVGAVLSVFFAGQFIEGNVLSPMIVGDRIRLHPVWLIFALFAFGYLFGFVGMLLAVPAAAAIGVLVRFALQAYLRSSLYSGSAKAGSKRG